jgi:hypothetical protein
MTPKEVYEKNKLGSCTLTKHSKTSKTRLTACISENGNIICDRNVTRLAYFPFYPHGRRRRRCIADFFTLHNNLEQEVHKKGVTF